MEAWLNRLPMPQFLRLWILIPLWHAIVRLSKPVNYERLHHFLRTFSERRPPAGRKPGGGGSIPFSDSMPAEKS